MTRKPFKNMRKQGWLVKLLSKFCTHPVDHVKYGPMEISVDFGQGFIFRRHFVVLCSWCHYLLDAGTQTWGEEMECSDCNGKGYVESTDGSLKDCRRCRDHQD